MICGYGADQANDVTLFAYRYAVCLSVLLQGITGLANSKLSCFVFLSFPFFSSQNSSDLRFSKPRLLHRAFFYPSPWAKEQVHHEVENKPLGKMLMVRLLTHFAQLAGACMLPLRMSLLQRRFGLQSGVCAQLLIESGEIDLSCKQVVLLVPNPRLTFSFLVEAKTGWPLASCK